jgi:hypothetical protein
LWNLQHWIFCSELLWLFVFPYLFHYCLFCFCEECHWNFDRDCIEHRECCW